MVMQLRDVEVSKTNIREGWDRLLLISHDGGRVPQLITHRVRVGVHSSIHFFDFDS